MVQILIEMNDKGVITVGTSAPGEATYFCLGLMRAAEKMMLEAVMPKEKPQIKKKQVQMYPHLRVVFDETINRLNRGEGAN